MLQSRYRSSPYTPISYRRRSTYCLPVSNFHCFRLRFDFVINCFYNLDFSATSSFTNIPYVMSAPCVMHDAQLPANGELSTCGHQVTDLIVELRDAPNGSTWHFTPCHRNIRCEY